MNTHNSFINSVYTIAQNAADLKIANLHTEDKAFEKNIININARPVVNFGSCSYLGLEFDERLKHGAIEAINKYGTQFSSSRAYVSLGIYEELESLFRQIFQGAFTLVAPTTTLGHLAAIPVLVHDNDCVILDHQVHSSVQNAANMLKARGIRVEMVRHNNVEMLEEKIKSLRDKYHNIWYMADGIYSMYGDSAPVQQIHALMDKYEQLNFYVDDAHGMSCFGKHGAGYVLQQAPLHKRQVLAVSLAKAFATGGSVLVFPTFEQYELVRACGGPMITSGPMQPGALGAAVASAKIHLSNEIKSLQQDLNENIKYTTLMLKKLGLPHINPTESPVFFVGASLPKIANRIIRNLIDDGYYLNLGIFPAVPLKNTGIRFTITKLHTFTQIEEMTERLSYHFEKTLQAENVDINQIYRAFRMANPNEENVMQSVSYLLNKNRLNIETADSITEIEPAFWNSLFEGRGSFDWNCLKLLEDSFTNNTNENNNWKFNYLVVKDDMQKPILATFFTTSRQKDDMLASAEISQQIEQLRKNYGHNYLTSVMVSMGSTLTEGEHLYLNNKHPLYKDALHTMIDFASQLQEMNNANSIMFRDFKTNDKALNQFFMDNGFIKSNLPESHEVVNFDWSTTEEWLATLSPKSRRHVRGNILKNENKYDVAVANNPTEAQVQHWYELYTAVKDNSLAINSFTLPYKLFKNIAAAPGWEVLELRIKNSQTFTKPVSVIFNYKSANTYSAMYIGVDYAAQGEHQCYRQALYQSILRAKHLGIKKVHLGFTSDLEKHRLGAVASPTLAYVQVKDNFNLSIINNLTKQLAIR